MSAELSDSVRRRPREGTGGETAAQRPWYAPGTPVAGMVCAARHVHTLWTVLWTTGMAAAVPSKTARRGERIGE